VNPVLTTIEKPVSYLRTFWPHTRGEKILTSNRMYGGVLVFAVMGVAFANVASGILPARLCFRGVLRRAARFCSSDDYRPAPGSTASSFGSWMPRHWADGMELGRHGSAPRLGGNRGCYLCTLVPLGDRA